MLEILQQLLTIGATGTGIYIGLAGLNAWKRETIGRRDLELCQTVVELFYEAEEKMATLRFPASYPVEGQVRKPYVDETAATRDRLDTLFVPLARFDLQLDFWAKFFSYKFRMRALFGEEAVTSFDTIDKCLREFRAAATARYQMLFPTGEVNQDERKSLAKFENLIWAMKDDHDTIGSKMKQAIIDIETICLPVVRRGPNFKFSRAIQAFTGG